MKLKVVPLAVLAIGGALLLSNVFLSLSLLADVPGHRKEIPTLSVPSPLRSTGMGGIDQGTPTPVEHIYLPAVTNDLDVELPSGTPTSAPTATATPVTHEYYVDLRGSDSNPGSLSQPWQTIEKAVKTVTAGDTLYVRRGEYKGIDGAWSFIHSGTATQPITITNYPREQVVFKVDVATENDRSIFGCTINPHNPPSWQTPKADYIRIIGTDVTSHTLSNGVESKKGIVMQGVPGEQSAAINVSDCDHWEVAGIDFIEMASAIFTHKNNWQGMEEHSTDHWYVHNNRVYNYYRESGMQFNGDENLIENNEIFKVSDELYSPYGCNLLNILGDHNIVRGNVLSRWGSTADCGGVSFEWDLADENLVERNLIADTTLAISFDGGDNNIIRNNVMYGPVVPYTHRGGIEIHSYEDTKTDWPCNESTGSAQAILPANDPSHPDYQYYYNPRNCHSYGNQIYNNTIHGFAEGIRILTLGGENTIIRNNTLSGWIRADFCYYQSYSGTCKPLPPEVTADHNLTEEPIGYVAVYSHDFRPQPDSPMIDAGYALGSLNSDDFTGNPRPQGKGYDIGAYEYIP